MQELKNKKIKVAGIITTISGALLTRASVLTLNLAGVIASITLIRGSGTTTTIY